MGQNFLYYGDNLDVLRQHVKDETIDLIYLDPPFNSNRTYNVLFAEQDGTRAAAQIKAFEDTWRWDQGAAAAWQEVVEKGGKISLALQGFRSFLGESDMMAYLAMMAPRLVELRRVLKPTGSIYLHCDPTASHYLKIIMDAVFGAENFRNEIVWCYTSGGKSKNTFAQKHDTILFYTKTDNYVFNADAVRIPYSAKTLANYKPGLKGSTYTAEVKLNENGKIPEDYWIIAIASKSTREYLHYPTQKPLTLLERIIKASSNEGDVVLDAFCGCGTSIQAAQTLKRRWIGIDITHLAITLIKHRLRDAFGGQAVYKVIGEPTSLADAGELAQEDPYQFQWWALGLVGARPVEQKKGADKGIDGRLFFHDEGGGGKTKQIIFSVKAGHTAVPHLRDLRGVLDREKAEIGVLLCMEEPTRPMRTEAASAGFYTSPFSKTRHPRLQLLTIAELLTGKGLDCPQLNVTYKRAAVHEDKGETPDLLFKDML